MSKQFDVVVGNPPYQKKRDPKDKKTQPIWQDFVDLSFKICKENGYICLVHPSGWRNVNGVFKKIGNKIKSKQIVYLNMNHFREGQKIFNVAIDFDWYCLKNTKNNNFLTTIKFQDNIIKDVDISNLEFIPSKMFDEVIGLIAKEGEEKVEILADSSHHTQSGLQKGFMSKKETKRFKYPCVYTVRSKNEPTFYWSSKKNGHFGIPKVIWGNGASGVIVDKKGEYSLTQYAYAIVDKVKNLKNIQKALKTEKFIKGIMGFEHSLGDKYNRRMIATFRKDFWKEFV